MAQQEEAKMKQKLLQVFLCGLWLLTLIGCDQSNMAASSLIAPGSAQAWFDFPVDGMVLSLKPYELVSNVTDPSGISQVEWTINDEVVATTGVDEAVNSVKNLFEFHYPWTPDLPGEYVLMVRAQSSDGVWSKHAKVVVIIPGEPTSTYTPTVTETVVTITPSFTPTETPTATPTSTPTPDKKLSLVNFTKSSSQFFYGGCTPDSLTLSIEATKPEEVNYMYLFYKLQDIQTGEMTKSNEGTPMIKQGANKWVITVKGSQIIDYNRFDSAWFVYQFISQNKDQSLTRSKQMVDVSFSVCGSVAPQVEDIPTPFILNPWE